MKTIAYVDGFNLYFRLLRQNRNLRWLDLEAFITANLPPTSELMRINYYTARVKGRIDADAPRKQQLYLKALSSSPLIRTHFGNFQIDEKWAGLIHPPEFLPPLTLSQPWPDTVKVRKAEEKGSDVNLAAHLVQDAYTEQFDQAIILTNDTDLVEPVRIVVQDVGKPVGLLAPLNNPARSLKNTASWVRHLKTSDAERCQFPDKVIDHKGQPVHKPSEWV